MTEALTILTSLRSTVGDSTDRQIQMEYIGIVQDVSFDKHFSSKSYASLLEKGIENNRRRTLLGIGIHMLTQLTGINVLLYVGLCAGLAKNHLSLTGLV